MVPISRPGGRRWLRRALPIGLAALLALGATATPVLAAAAPPPLTTSLLPPTGHHRVGTVRLHLVDRNRTDPSVPSHPLREIMVQLWYPATDTARYPTAPYLPPLAAAHFLAGGGLPADTVLPATIGHTGAPADHRHGPHPVVLYSPGSGADGVVDTGLAEDLATHGYIVVVLDDTFDSPEVEFPGGRLVAGTGGLPTPVESEALRAADASFVLNELTILHNGGNPDAERAPLPDGLGRSLDLSRVGMFGWSIGGAASAEAMNNDPRIRAGINMDGRFWGPEANTGVRRPFLLFTSSDHNDAQDPTLAPFLAASAGPKFRLNLANSQHQTYSDAEEILPQVASTIGLTSEQVAESIGTIDPATAVTDERGYIRAFFDRFLRNRDNHLLDGPSPRFPDIQFQS